MADIKEFIIVNYRTLETRVYKSHLYDDDKVYNPFTLNYKRGKDKTYTRYKGKWTVYDDMACDNLEQVEQAKKQRAWFPIQQLENDIASWKQRILEAEQQIEQLNKMK